jgi:hypothetical protein
MNSDSTSMHRWRELFREARQPRDDGLLRGAQLRWAIQQCPRGRGYLAAAFYLRMSEAAVRRSVERARCRGLLNDPAFVQSLTDEQLERAAYLRRPRTLGKSISQVRELELAHLAKIMGREFDT